MPIKFCLSVISTLSPLLAPGLFLLAFNLLPLPSLAETSERDVLGVVKSIENANQWTGIKARLQVAGVAYCVIELPSVKSATDLGDRTVVFLPNIEMLTPTQVIALEEWMSRGGRVIASGPVGNLSQPGVRHLLRSLLGAYWGLSLNTPSNLQPLQNNKQEWVDGSGLGGTVQGGIVMPTSIGSTSVAFWQSKDNPPAVVVTDRSTVLGWHWGIDATAPVELDSAWLRAVLSRHIQLPSTNVDSGSLAKNCDGTVATVSTPPTPAPPVASISPPLPLPLPKPQPLEEPLERLAPAGLELEASALRQELENLIGRFESALLSANARRSKETLLNHESTQVASTSSSLTGLTESGVNAVAKVREIAKALPDLVKQQKYADARLQWLKAQRILWEHYPSDRTLAQPEIRAIWLDRGSIIRAGTEQGLAKIFDQLAAAGINTVFFETVNAGYPIYPSKVAPQQNPLVRGWDPLASGVKLAHERGIEIHAWVWTFAAGNQRHNAVVNLPANYPGPLIAAHPNWASYDNRGSLFPPGQGKPFLDPANPEVRRYLLGLFDEIVSRYQVDGLQLDYIRYPFQDPGADRTYGYGLAARQQFQQLTGVDPTQIRPGDLHWQKWTEFRTTKIDTFVAEVSQKLRQKRPNLILSVAVFPLSEHDRLQKLQQHWEVWASRGDVDLIVPMTYALDTYRFQRLTQPWISSTKLGSALVLPGIRLLDLPLSVALDQLQLARDLPISGYSLFAVEHFSNDLQKILRSTQGSVQTPVPYRQPFQTAAARYAALQQEWNFLLDSKRLSLREPVLSDWRNQTQVLESSLNQLAAAPSVNRLTVARASLTAFRSQFPEWTRLYALENPYQAKVWANRLGTLEKLLRYGERVELKR